MFEPKEPPFSMDTDEIEELRRYLIGEYSARPDLPGYSLAMTHALMKLDAIIGLR